MPRHTNVPDASASYCSDEALSACAKLALGSSMLSAMFRVRRVVRSKAVLRLQASRGRQRARFAHERGDRRSDISRVDARPSRLDPRPTHRLWPQLCVSGHHTMPAQRSRMARANRTVASPGKSPCHGQCGHSSTHGLCRCSRASSALSDNAGSGKGTSKLQGRERGLPSSPKLSRPSPHECDGQGTR